VRCVAMSPAPRDSVLVEDNKTRYLVEVREQVDADFAENIGDSVRACALAWSFAARVHAEGLTAINSLELRNNHQATAVERQAFVEKLAAACASVRDSGAEPIVLAGNAAPGAMLRPYRWGPGEWQCPLPPGVEIRAGDAALGEIAPAYLNDVPVVDFNTPSGDCYVVPWSMVKTLEVGGGDPSRAVTLTWERVNDERLKLTATWSAQLG
jgi:hypothetical protein